MNEVGHSGGGVDAVFVGPNDLGIALGVPGPPTTPEVDAAITRVAEASRRAGIWSAVQMNTPEGAERFAPHVDQEFALPGTRLRTTVGAGGANLRIKTLSGDVSICDK